MSKTRTLAIALSLAALAPAFGAGLAKRAERTRALPAAAAPTRAPMAEDEAVRNVAMLDDAYGIILHTVHQTYPTRTGQPIVAAAVVRQLQAKMGQLGWPKSRFLSVNALVMNPEHRARDDFERDAVNALRSGSNRYEMRQGGRLRVARSISLGGGCFSCHWSDAKIGSRAAICFDIPISSNRQDVRPGGH